MNVEIVENRKALTTVRNKKKELKDLDNHAYQAGSETSPKCGGRIRQCGRTRNGLRPEQRKYV